MLFKYCFCHVSTDRLEYSGTHSASGLVNGLQVCGLVVELECTGDSCRESATRSILWLGSEDEGGIFSSRNSGNRSGIIFIVLYRISRNSGNTEKVSGNIRSHHRISSAEIFCILQECYVTIPCTGIFLESAVSSREGAELHQVGHHTD